MKTFTLITLLCALALSASASVLSFAWDASAGADGYTLTLTPTQPFFSATKQEIEVYQVDTNEASIVLTGGTWSAMVCAWSTNNPQHIRIESSYALLGPFTVPDDTGKLAVNISAPMFAPELVLSSNKTARATLWLAVSTNLIEWSAWTPVIDFWLGDGARANYKAALTIANQ